MNRSLRTLGAIAAEELAQLAGATKLDTLEEILRWGGHVHAVIVQDEYNHDVVVTRGDSAFLVFDTT